MKRKQAPETSPAEMMDVSGLQRKPYQLPALRVFGSVHFLTRTGVATVNGDGGALMMVVSDRVVKENVVRIAEHPLGIGLYLFDYRHEYRERYGDGRQFGVMADEVEAVMPAAVSVAPRGHKQVNYAMLGITRPAR